jgi:hypothetical protein
MRRIFVERLRVTAPSGEQRKFSNGGERKGPAVQPFRTCAEISADRAVVVSGESKADRRFLHDCELVVSPVKPRFAPCRIMWIIVDTKSGTG